MKIKHLHDYELKAKHLGIVLLGVFVFTFVQALAHALVAVLL